MSTTYDRILEIFKEVLDFPVEQEIQENSTFKELEIDSMDLVEVIFAIEEEFDIEIPDENLKTFDTVGSAIRFVENLI